MNAGARQILRGRHFFANPGPTNIPDSILRAIDRPTIDFNDADFLPVFTEVLDGIKRILGTRHHLFMYTGSGHAAWEATLTNLLSPGDAVLMVDSGYFSETWGKMATAHGLATHKLAADWRQGVKLERLREALEADHVLAIKAVCVVHNETSTGMATPLPKVRAALDAAHHPALLLVDTISSLASIPFYMDAWGIDAAVGGSQKGLMNPAGISFTAVSEKGMAAHERAKLGRFYFDWSVMLNRNPHRSFVGTVPVSAFYGLNAAIKMIEEEGLDAVLARHHRLAEGVRRAVAVWAGNDGPQLFCADPSRVSDSVTAVLMPEGYDAEALRAAVRGRFNVSLGGGLGPLAGRVFRIGHMGDLNEPMVLGVLAAVEMAFRQVNVPHGRGGVDAAMEHFCAA